MPTRGCNSPLGLGRSIIIIIIIIIKVVAKSSVVENKTEENIQTPVAGSNRTP